MPSQCVRLLATTMVLWLSAVAVARAGYLDWSYTWDRSPFAVPANGGSQAGVVSLQLPSLPAGGGPGASPIAPIVLVAGTTEQGAETSPADLFNNAAYSATLNVTDNQTNAGHAFVFNGLLNGSMTTSLVHLTNSFTGGDQQSFTISGRLYTITLGFAAPDASADSFAGDITASVQVGDAPILDPPPPTRAPEPATLALAVAALPSLGAVVWRRFIRRAAAASRPD